MDEQTHLHLLGKTGLALDPPPYDSRTQSPVPYNEPKKSTDWSNDPKLGIDKKRLLEEIIEATSKDRITVHRIVDGKGNMYATVGDDGKLKVYSPNPPECLCDSGICLVPCWCKCSWILRLGERLGKWCIMRSSDERVYLQQSMSRLD